VIYRDTIKFEEKHLSINSNELMNINSYSMLYVVNGAYFYILDIIPSDKVIEFVNEILDIDKIEGIGILSKEKLRETLFDGVRIQNGIVAIRLKKRAKFNPIVAGLKLSERGTGSGGDNFTIIVD
jgi:hypothetical protein